MHKVGANGGILIYKESFPLLKQSVKPDIRPFLYPVSGRRTSELCQYVETRSEIATRKLGRFSIFTIWADIRCSAKLMAGYPAKSVTGTTLLKYDICCSLDRAGWGMRISRAMEVLL